MLSEWHENGNSNSIATILVVAITLILAILVLLLFHLPSLDWDNDPPVLFRISSISHSDRLPTSTPNFDSRITLVHTGHEPVENDVLLVEIYVNKKRLNCHIETLNGYVFISSHHFGVQTISGSGCRGDIWDPGEKIAIDLSDGSILPGDSVRVDIIRKQDGTVISRDSCIA